MDSDVAVAVIDSGIDLNSGIFQRNKDRFIGFYSCETDIFIENYDEALESTLFIDPSGHGSAVTEIVLNNTTRVKLLIIKLRETVQNGFIITTALMEALDFATKYSIRLNLPMVINVSYGTNYGSHSGDSLLEEYMDETSYLSRLSIVTGSGNNGDKRLHTDISLDNTSYKTTEIFVDSYTRAINIGIWSDSNDIYDITMITPAAEEITLSSGTGQYKLSEQTILCARRNATFYSRFSESLIVVVSNNDYVIPGIYRLLFKPRKILSGNVNIWIIPGSSESEGVFFLSPNPYVTLTIPSTTKNVITVGAYNQNNFSVPPFSGRGNPTSGLPKPDVVARGVNIYSEALDTRISGTSFAAPYVSAKCAELMYDGIVLQNDIYLYGERLKQAIINSAVRLTGVSYPNPTSGWGYIL